MSKRKKPTTKALETKFAETAFRLSQERNDFLLPQIVDFVRAKKWLNLRPEYQRRLVWDDGQRSRFIESLLLNIPVPPIFLYEWDLGRYEVMDGQQRLNAIVEFYENAFALKGLESWEELNGFQFKDLPDTLQRGLHRRRLSATVLLVESSSNVAKQKNDIRKLVFERLNTGGLQLNPQELRNCLYDSPFNKLLIELSHDRSFCEIWDIPPFEDNVDSKGNVSQDLRSHRLYRRMVDCEIVLRFFALRRRGNIRGSMRAMLDRCMESYLPATKKEMEELGKEYRSRLQLAKSIFLQHVFRYRNEAGEWEISLPLYDGVMVALDQHWSIRTRLLMRRAKIRRALAKLLSQREAYEVIVGRPNTARAVAARIELIARTIVRAARS